MEIKKVKCPQCGVVLEVKNSANVAIKDFVCPGCGAGLRVRFGIDQIIEEPVEDSTRLVQPITVQGPVLVSNGKFFELHLGRNIIGRKADSSVADIQIATDDKLLSRHHALISVESQANGSLRVTLTNYKNKNITRVNGLILVDDDVVVLSDNSTILMGATTMIFTYNNK